MWTVFSGEHPEEVGQGGNGSSVTTTLDANPIDTLPPELLGKIFSLYVHDEGGRRGIKLARISSLPDNYPYTPVTLGHVCSQWRTIVHSTPSFWAKIHVLNPKEHNVLALRMWIDRSSPLPLHLSFREARYNETANKCWRKIFNVAMSQSHRWEYLEMILRTDDWYVEEKWKALRVPNLRSANIRPGQWESNKARDIYTRVSASPVLETLTFNRQCYIPTWVPNFPWTNLKSVGIVDGATYPDKVWELLKGCTSLERCDVRGIIPTLSGPAPSSTVTIASLRSLSLTYGYGSSGVPLNWVNLPSLTELSISWDHRAGDTWGILTGLGSRSDWPLKTFTFSSSSPTSEGIAEGLLFPAFSQLTHLRIDSRVRDVFLRGLFFTKSSQPLAKLTSLHLSKCHATDGVLSDMLVSRTNQAGESPMSLRYVYAGLWAPPEEAGHLFEKDLALKIPKVTLELTINEFW